jgi:hypothetical protein
MHRAEELYAQACTGGAPEGCYNAGRLVAASPDPQSKDAAISLYDHACAGGLGVGCGAQARLLSPKDRGTLENIARLYSRGCDLGDDQSCVGLADLRASRPTLGGRSAAIPLLENSCARGGVAACARAGKLAIGNATASELSSAHSFLQKACKLGDESGCLGLAWVLARSEVASRLPDSAPLRRARLTAAHFAAIAGKAEHVQKLIEPFLQEDEADAARFILACTALDAGRLDDATSLIAPLRNLSPPDPAVHVLAGLIERQRRGEESWTEAMVRAWAAAGKPNARASRFLWNGEEVFSLPSARFQQSSEESALAFVLQYLDDMPDDAAGVRSVAEPVPSALVERSFRYAQDDRDEIRLVALAVLTKPGIPEALLPKARAAVARSLAGLAAHRPSEALWLLWPLIVDTGGTALSETELTQLEAAASRPSWGMQLRDLYGPYRDLLARLDQSASRETALGLAVDMLQTDLANRLAVRLRATAAGAPPEKRSRVSRCARSLGDLLAKNGTLVESAVAGYLLRAAAEISGVAEDVRHADEVRAAFQRDYTDWGTTQSTLGLWPLHSYYAEWMDNVGKGELAFFAQLRHLGENP